MTLEEKLIKYVTVRKTPDQQLKNLRFGLLLKYLGNPHTKFRSVHVTGTSGKGSTATFLSYIVSKSGYRTGLNLSPHVSSLTERFQIDTVAMNEEKLNTYFDQIVPSIDRVGAQVAPVSYFEVVTALAFYVFAQENVEIAVVEAGIGGAGDITTILEPEVSIITNVDYDHTEILGGTLEKIALQKAGIIKPNTPIVSGVTQESVVSIIKNKAMLENASLSLVTPDWYSIKSSQLRGSIFDFQSTQSSFENLHVSLLGRHQIINATLAVQASLLLREKGYRITEESIRDGLAKAFLPARVELISQNPTIILDGAHNPAKIQTTVATIQELFPGKKCIVIYVPKKDKDVDTILGQLASIAQTVILTPLGNVPIPMLLHKTQVVLQQTYHISTQIASDSRSALETARNLASDESIILITGSFYLAGELRP